MRGAKLNQVSCDVSGTKSTSESMKYLRIMQTIICIP